MEDESECVWTATQQKAFDKLKQAITNSATLCYFNPKLFQTKLQVDASIVGLGAAIIQINPAEPEKERIIACASKNLSDVETRYGQSPRL